MEIKPGQIWSSEIRNRNCDSCPWELELIEIVNVEDDTCTYRRPLMGRIYGGKTKRGQDWINTWKWKDNIQQEDCNWITDNYVYVSPGYPSKTYSTWLFNQKGYNRNLLGSDGKRYNISCKPGSKLPVKIGGELAKKDLTEIYETDLKDESIRFFLENGDLRPIELVLPKSNDSIKVPVVEFFKNAEFTEQPIYKSYLKNLSEEACTVENFADTNAKFEYKSNLKF